MVGGGSRKDEALVINSTNVFAALGSLRKKKKGSDKDGVKGKASASKNSVKQSFDEKPDPQVFWAPAPLNAKSWGDVDDEDDDDYFATPAPPRPAWDDDADDGKAKGSVTPVEESESEEEGLDEVDDEEEHEHEQDPEPEGEPELVIPVAKKPAEVVAPKESERQLSKKELKKKELEELDAMLAEFGLKPEGQGDSQEKKAENLNGEVDKKENVASGESKNAKKKKKKDKTAKDAKEQQEKPNGNEVGNGADETLLSVKADEAPAVDMKEKLKKVAAAKKKKSSKEMDAAAKAAANEAAARNARLAAAKKKEKNHYNQQPVR
ncbi:hypothetical protein Leryth_022547 [Lithospermum erythrorhizon]|nr:hypothetical protein Leryth_022547 [Lithospermum erythrorhizon]